MTCSEEQTPLRTAVRSSRSKWLSSTSRARDDDAASRTGVATSPSLSLPLLWYTYLNDWISGERSGRLISLSKIVSSTSRINLDGNEREAIRWLLISMASGCYCGVLLLVIGLVTIVPLRSGAARILVGPLQPSMATGCFPRALLLTVGWQLLCL